MIDKIEIKNFRRHTDTTIEFDKGITCIAGKNQIGKSTVIEALLWVKENRPLGDDYVSHSARNKKGKQILDCEVTVTKGENVLTRKKSDTFNGYILNGVEFDTIGTSVPDEVVAFFNLSTENIQRQNEPHFLITETGASIAKYFNKIIDLRVIDSATETAKSLIRSTKTKQTEKTNNIEKTQLSLNKLPDLEVLDNLIKLIDTYLSEQKILQSDITQIERNCEMLRNWYNELVRIPDTFILAEKYDSLLHLERDKEKHVSETNILRSQVQFVENSYLELSKIPNQNELLEKYQATANLQTEYQNITQTINLLKDLLVAKTALVEQNVKNPVEPCVSLYKQIIDLQTEHKPLATEIDDIRRKKHCVGLLVSQKERLGGIKVSIQEILDLEGIRGSIQALMGFVKIIIDTNAEKEQLLTELTEIKENMGDVCPTCGAPLDKEAICSLS